MNVNLRVDGDLGNLLHHSIQAFLGLRIACLREQKDKLIAAVSCKHIVPADVFHAGFADLYKRLVACNVTVGVVDHFKIVEIQNGDGAGPAVTLDACDLVVCQFKEMTAVVSPGQVVGDGQNSQLLFGLVQLIEQGKRTILKERRNNGWCGNG